MLEQMDREINEKAVTYLTDEQSFPYKLRLMESANIIKVTTPATLTRLLSFECRILSKSISYKFKELYLVA